MIKDYLWVKHFLKTRLTFQQVFLESVNEMAPLRVGDRIKLWYRE